MAEMPRLQATVDVNITTEPTLEDFEWRHLQENHPFAARASRQFWAMARWQLENLPPNAHRALGLWDLLRAKDCAVRSALAKQRALELREQMIQAERKNDDSAT